MSRKRHKPEKIVTKLRQVEVLTAQGRTVAEAIRSIGVTEVTYYRWRRGIRRAQRRSGNSPEGVGSREHAAPASGC